jgi:hypothetical protein
VIIWLKELDLDITGKICYDIDPDGEKVHIEVGV